ncbi:MAG: septal ring lytic transglycosylase RlpA family protein [Candidatus Scalindua sp.]|nr:septal ring lytic transglycosylase RlpA family protein [Candidatus Scalindua sp.]
MFMRILQNMRIRKMVALSIGIICIIGCGRTNIRDASNKEVNSREAVIKESGTGEVNKDESSTRAIKKDETNIKEIVIKEVDIGSSDPLEASIKEEAEETKNNDKQSVSYDEVGNASFISDEYDGKMTASGVRYDRNKMTAAHPSLPFDTRVLITNIRNKREVEVIIIDRFSPTKDRILNVSHSAAEELDLVESGIAKVGIKIIANPD